LVIVIASLFVITIGISARLAQADNAARDEQRAAQEAEYRAQQKCLNEFAADFVRTVAARAGANKAVLDAQTRKDEALDKVFDLLAANNAAPAEPGSEAEDVVRKNFEAAVAERVAAQSALKTATSNAEATLNENPYEVPKTPKAVC
jgi:hypothetical protein